MDTKHIMLRNHFLKAKNKVPQWQLARMRHCALPDGVLEKQEDVSVIESLMMAH